MKTNILKMIEQAEVVWKPLGEVAEIYGGLTGKTKNDFENGNAKYITYKNIFGNIEVEPNNLETVKILDNERQHQVKHGDILFTGSSEIAEEAGISSSVTTRFDKPIYLNSFSFGVRFNQNIEIIPEFSKYLFRCHYMRNQIIKTASGVTRFNISKERFKKIVIPIPPLELQKEIVKRLDILTELEATLEAELTLRKKQYQYYRDFLLSENELAKVGFEWKSLGEVAAKISSGGTPKTGMDEYYNGDIPWLRTQEVNFGEIWDTGIKITEAGVKNSSAKWIPKNCVILAMYGATVGKVAINKIPMTTNQACANIQVDESILSYRYLFHYLSSKYEYIKSLGTGSQTNINAQIVKGLQIPIPPLDTQAKIVAILDTFDRLTSSITDGLPKEIELRRKQYEHYRELLLGFPMI